MSRFIHAIRQWLHRRRMQRLARLPAYIGVDLTRCNDQTAGLLPQPSEAETVRHVENETFRKPTLELTFDTEAVDRAIKRITAAAEKVAAWISDIGLASVVEEITLMSYGQPAEIHRMCYARKARTRKKYRNRIKRRARRAMKKEART